MTVYPGMRRAVGGNRRIRAVIPRETVAAPLVRNVPMVGTLIVYLVALAVIMGVNGSSESAGYMYWIASVVGVGLYAMAFAVALIPPPGGLTLRAAGGSALLALAAQAGFWVAVAVDPSIAVRSYIPILATAYVVDVILVTRNRMITAWVGALSGIAMSVGVALTLDLDRWWSAIESMNVLTLAVTTAGALALSPFLGAIDALAAHGKQATVKQAAELALKNDRDMRIRRIEERARLLFTGILSSGEVTESDVRNARLFEARLRDGIRAPSFDTHRFRDTVWDARARGVTVTLLDDGGLREVQPELSKVFLARFLPRLRAELDALDDAEVIARISPPGRDPVGTITIAEGGRHRRIEVGMDGRIVKVVQA